MTINVQYVKMLTSETMTDYVTKKLNKLEIGSDDYNKIIERSDKRINKYYKIYSYHVFVRDIKKISLRNSVLIIDEIQNMISETGKFYKALRDKINK